MNNLQIVNSAIALNDNKPINMVIALAWLQEACGILANKYSTSMIKTSKAIDCTDIKTGYELPSDCVSVKSAIDSNNEKYNGFTVSEGLIYFDKVDNFTIVYARYPVIVERKAYETEINTDVPEINVAYHSCLSYYLASMAISSRNSADQRAADYENKFMNLADSTNSRLSRVKSRGARIKAPVWR